MGNSTLVVRKKDVQRVRTFPGESDFVTRKNHNAINRHSDTIVFASDPGNPQSKYVVAAPDNRYLNGVGGVPTPTCNTNVGGGTQPVSGPTTGTSTGSVGTVPPASSACTGTPTTSTPTSNSGPTGTVTNTTPGTTATCTTNTGNAGGGPTSGVNVPGGATLTNSGATPNTQTCIPAATLACAVTINPVTNITTAPIPFFGGGGGGGMPMTCTALSDSSPMKLDLKTILLLFAVGLTGFVLYRKFE